MLELELCDNYEGIIRNFYKMNKIYARCLNFLRFPGCALRGTPQVQYTRAFGMHSSWCILCFGLVRYLCLLPSIFFSLVLCSESFALSRGFAAGEQVLDTGRQVGFVKAPLLDLFSALK